MNQSNQSTEIAALRDTIAHLTDRAEAWSAVFNAICTNLEDIYTKVGEGRSICGRDHAVETIQAAAAELRELRAENAWLRSSRDLNHELTQDLKRS